VKLSRKGCLSEEPGQTDRPIDEMVELIRNRGCCALNSSMDVGFFLVGKGKLLPHKSQAVALSITAIVMFLFCVFIFWSIK